MFSLKKRYISMLIVLSLFLISCSQNIFIGSVEESYNSIQEVTSQTLTYCRINLIDGIQYEIPSDWQTYEETNRVYHYFNDEHYLMVSSVTTEFSKDIDQTLTNECADALIETFKEYSDFLLEDDCTGNIDGFYCRKISCSYSNESNQRVVERGVVFSIGGVVYSFDCVSLSNQQKNYEDFRRIIGSIICQ